MDVSVPMINDSSCARARGGQGASARRRSAQASGEARAAVHRGEAGAARRHARPHLPPRLLKVHHPVRHRLGWRDVNESSHRRVRHAHLRRRVDVRLHVLRDGVKPVRDVLPRIVNDRLREHALVLRQQAGQVVHLAEKRYPAVIRAVVFGHLLRRVHATLPCGSGRRGQGWAARAAVGTHAHPGRRGRVAGGLTGRHRAMTLQNGTNAGAGGGRKRN